MTLLAAVHYDPATAVSKSTATLLAMTAVDTTNLRLAFTPPGSRVLVHARGGRLHGAATYPQILLGILEGSTVRARQHPIVSVAGQAAATTGAVPELLAYVTGLTAGAALTWDLAYGVETAVSGTGWKYGGPNNATADDAHGGISFAVFDPS